MTVPPVPGEGSTKDQLMAFLHNQLDRIEAAVHHGRQGELLGGLRFTGSGPQDRLQGGVHACVYLMHVAFVFSPLGSHYPGARLCVLFFLCIVLCDTDLCDSGVLRLDIHSR